MLPGTHFYSWYSYYKNSRFIPGITVIPGIIYSSFQEPAPGSYTRAITVSLFSSCSCNHVNTHKKLARAHIPLKIGDAVRINILEGCHESLDNTRKSTGRFTTNRDLTTHAVPYLAPRAQDFPVRCHILDRS